MLPKTDLTEAFWQTFANSAGAQNVDNVVVTLGDSSSMAAHLAELVVRVTKRVTCSLVRDCLQSPENFPKVDGFVVVLDGNDQPRRIWRTTEVEVKPLIAVDDQFALDKGQGNRSRAWWLDAHRNHFGQQAVRYGFEMRDEIPCVFERFEVV